MEQLNLLELDDLSFVDYMSSNQRLLTPLYNWYTSNIDSDFNTFINKPIMFNLGIMILFLESHNIYIGVSNHFFMGFIIDPSKESYDLSSEMLAKGNTEIFREESLKSHAIATVYIAAIITALTYLDKYGN